MVIYLIAITVFMTECLTMYFTYLNRQKEFKNDFKNAYHQRTQENFFYFFLIPCLNEGKVIKQTLEQLVTRPGEKQIIVIDDDSSDDTLDKVDQVEGPISKVARKLPNAQSGKGNSLNSAMPLVLETIKKKKLDPTHCIVGVLDADGILSNNAIYKLNDIFSDLSNDAVQLRVKMKSPKRIIQIFQDIEFFVVDNLIQMMRTNIHSVAFCGNGQFFRFSTVYDRVGLQPWGTALLEDFELTLKFELCGLTIKYVSAAYVDQEALINARRLINQRARWSQGGWDCWKYLKSVVGSKIMTKGQKFDVYFFLLEPILNILADFSIIYLTIKFLIQYHTNPEFLFVSITSLAILGLLFGSIFTYIYIREIRLNDKADIVIQKSDMINGNIHLGTAFLAIGLMSYIYILLFFSLTIATYHKLTGENSWNKTKRI